MVQGAHLKVETIIANTGGLAFASHRCMPKKHSIMGVLLLASCAVSPFSSQKSGSGITNPQGEGNDRPEYWGVASLQYGASATLIRNDGQAPATLLTCGHCVADASGVKKSSIGLTTFPGIGGSRDAQFWIAHPSYNAGDGKYYDVGLIFLHDKQIKFSNEQGKEQPLQQFDVGYRAPLGGEPVTIVGFGKTTAEAHVYSAYGTRRWGPNKVAGTGMTPLVFNLASSEANHSKFCYGDSGGPTLDQNNKVLGVNIRIEGAFANDPCAERTSRVQRVDGDIQRWIQHCMRAVEHGDFEACRRLPDENTTAPPVANETVTKTGLSISGRVLNNQGDAVSGVRVTAWGPTEAPPEQQRMFPDRGQTFSQDTGHFSVTIPAQGHYNLRANGVWLSPTRPCVATGFPEPGCGMKEGADSLESHDLVLRPEP